MRPSLLGTHLASDEVPAWIAPVTKLLEVLLHVRVSQDRSPSVAFIAILVAPIGQRYRGCGDRRLTFGNAPANPIIYPV